MRCFMLTAALLITSASPPAASAQPAARTRAAPAALSVEEQRAVDRALKRGRLLFALDRAAWVATDDMRARVRDPVAAGVRGYIVDRDARGLTTIFFGREGERLVAVYRARMGASGVEQPEVFAAGARPALTPMQQRLARALESVRGVGGLERCSRQPLNAAIVPPDSLDAPIDIYLMTPQERSGALPFGGHQRITLAADGREVSRRSFARSCLTLTAPTAEQRRQGGMLSVSHFLDPVPTEIHVFTALAAGMPIGVIAERPPRVWEVTGERITLLQDGPIRTR